MRVYFSIVSFYFTLKINKSMLFEMTNVRWIEHKYAHFDLKKSTKFVSEMLKNNIRPIKAI